MSTDRHSLSTAAPGSVTAARTEARIDWLLVVYMGIIVAHILEHAFQAVQVFALAWPRPEARGALGLVWPGLISSETLHYGHAILMLAGLYYWRNRFAGTARTWWMAAFWLQMWHHAEHLLLFGQAQTGLNLLGHAVPTSVLQLWLPRVELHLFYNVMVLIPMAVALMLHPGAWWKAPEREAAASAT